MGDTRREDAGELFRALATVNRLQATVGYNAAYVAIAVGLGVLTTTTPASDLGPWLRLAVVYAVATMLAKMQASVADVIHDAAVDAVNPVKSTLSTSLERLGTRRAWSVLAVETVAALVLAGIVAVEIDAVWPVLAAGSVVVLGFVYSFPPRLKERDVLNHVTTTAVDVFCLLVPVAYLVGRALTPVFVVVGSVVFCYTFAYHIVHQAADTYYDRQAGVQTYTTRVGVERSLVVAAGFAAVAAGLAVALGFPIATVGALWTVALYVRVYAAVQGRDEKAQTDAVAARFDIARVATLSNVVTALAVWNQALDIVVVSL